MIPSSGAQYRMRYNQCTHDKNHAGESMNFVCLAPGCAEQSLICSMCRNDQHKGHPTSPLKYYIETLKKEYEGDARNFEHEFETLEESRTLFLIRLREAVEKAADQFRKLEEQVMDRFNAIRAQIAEEQAKRNKFADFYRSLTKQNADNPDFLIQNYLPTKQLAPLQNFGSLEKLGGDLGKLVSDVRDTLLASENKNTDQKQIEQPVQDIGKLLQLAKSVTRNSNNFSQSDTNFNAQTMSILKVDLKKQLKSGRIKIKIARLKKGGTVYIGAIRKDLFDSLSHKAPPNWLNPHHIGKLHFYNNQGSVYGHSSSQLKTFSQGSNMEVSIQDGKMKIAMKKASAEYLLGEGEFYFFFNLAGNVEIEMKYLPGQ